MNLYHGTSERVAKLVQSTGLVPRSKHRGKHNWKHVFAGNRDTVYLTDAYPVTYAVEAVDTIINANKQATVTDRLAIIEIDADRLDLASFVPDEDVLEQSLRKRDELPAEWTLAQRCRHYQARLRQYQDQWETSLRLLGTCGYMGDIPPTAITRIALINYKVAAIPVWWALDASISFANYRVVGIEHKAITRWFFGDPMPEMTETQKFIVGDRLERMKQWSRDGVEVIACDRD